MVGRVWIYGIGHRFFKGSTHRATDALQWLSMSTYRCIESVCLCVGTLFFLQQSAFIEMVINGKCYFGVSTKFKHA